MQKSMTGAGFVLAAALAACSSNSGAGALTLNAMVPKSKVAGALSAVSATSSASGLSLSDGQNTLVLTSAEVVLRGIKFDHADGTIGCSAGGVTDASGEGSSAKDGECEDFKAEPMILALPLNGSVSRQVTANVAAGSYKKVSFKVHKLGGDALDKALQSSRPDMQGVSVLVKGTLNGAAFTYISNLEAEQEIELNPPMQVSADGSQVGVTLSVDAAGWFVGSGAVLDPRQAGVGGALEETVRRNIEASFEGFEDNDHDGTPHGADADEKG